VLSLHWPGGTERDTENMSQAMLCAGGDSKWRLPATSPHDHDLTELTVLLSVACYLMMAY
jgi:hypothetical protein